MRAAYTHIDQKLEKSMNALHVTADDGFTGNIYIRLVTSGLSKQASKWVNYSMPASIIGRHILSIKEQVELTRCSYVCA